MNRGNINSLNLTKSLDDKMRGTHENVSSVGDFLSLLKPRVMLLVVFTGFVGMQVAPGSIHPIMQVLSILCIALGSGAAGAINMWYDRDIDTLMTRTKNRPIPSGKIHHTEVLHFGVFLSFTSVITMGLFINVLSAGILAISILFYVFIYTIWLKRRSVQNIVIGGAAGAFPPIIGYSVVTNSIGVESLFLFLIIFMWTPPHFWSLSIYSYDDYKLAKVPMMPVVMGDQYTKMQILIYTVGLFVVTLLPSIMGIFGLIYLVTAVVLGVGFIKHSYFLWKDSNHPLKVFKFSIVYLFILFLSVIVDHYYFIKPFLR